MIETIGAKIRNRLSPYSLVVELIEMGEDEKALELLKKRAKRHREIINELVELSKECEIEPSDRWDKLGG